MTSKVAIVTDEIRKVFTAGQPARHAIHDRPDFKLKRFENAGAALDAASTCADAGTVYGSGKL